MDCRERQHNSEQNKTKGGEEQRWPVNRLRRGRRRRVWQSRDDRRRIAQLPSVEQVVNQPGQEQNRNGDNKKLHRVNQNSAPTKLPVANAIDDGGLKDEELGRYQH